MIISSRLATKPSLFSRKKATRIRGQTGNEQKTTPKAQNDVNQAGGDMEELKELKLRVEVYFWILLVFMTYITINIISHIDNIPKNIQEYQTKNHDKNKTLLVEPSGRN